MQFTEVVQQRRMVRSFLPRAVAPEITDRLLDLARRAPSAGNTWGTHFVVLEGAEQTGRYWDLTLPPERRPAFPWPGLLDAPLLILPCGDADAYVSRYAEQDKARTGLGESAEDWAIPYWHVDTAMAAMTVLHAAVDEGLGALFFGLFDHEPAIAEALGIPAAVRPIGTIAIGHPAGESRTSKSAGRGLPRLETIVHRGAW
jgi:nitroreductase